MVDINPQNIGNVSKDETNLIDESFYEEYVPIQKNSRLFKFLLNATKIEIKFNSLIKLVSRTSLFELGFWVFGFFLFIASSSDMWLIWLLVLHIFKGVYGILLLEAIPKTQDIIETVASKPNVEEDKIMELIQEEIKNSFSKKWTDNKGKFFCYFITTIISVFIDIIIFIVQIAAFGKDEWILMQTCMLFIMLVFIISDIIYFLWFFTIKFSLSEDIYDAVRKAIFGSVTDLKSLVLSKFKRNSNPASN